MVNNKSQKPPSHNAPKGTLLGGIIALLITLAAISLWPPFQTYFGIEEWQKSFLTPPRTLNADISAQAPLTPPPQKNEKQIQPDYIAGLPSFGPLINTVLINVEFGTDLARGYLKVEDAASVALQQDVVLYDSEGMPLPLGGVVDYISPPIEGLNQVVVTIKLPAGTRTKYLQPEMEIITQEIDNAKRLPITALQYDANMPNQAYVWRIPPPANAPPMQEYEGVYEDVPIEKLYINVGGRDQDYFEEGGHKIEAFDYIILNPDENITAQEKYNVLFSIIFAPLHNPIRQAWIDYEVYRLNTKQQELDAIAAACNAKAFSRSPEDEKREQLDSEKGAACDIPDLPEGGKNPLAIFESLLNTP